MVPAVLMFFLICTAPARACCSLPAQIMVWTSPFPHTGISEIGNTAMILVLGGRYYVGTGIFELSLTDDPNTSGVPDFT